MAINLFDSINQIGQKQNATTSDLADFAKQRGMIVRGQNTVENRFGVEYSTPLEYLRGDFDKANGSPQTFLSQVGSIAKAEGLAKQEAADRQFGRNQEATAQFKSFLDGIPARFTAVADQSSNFLDGIMGGLLGDSLGQEAKAEGAINSMVRDQNKRLDDALGGIDAASKATSLAYNAGAAKAEAAARDAINQYDTGINEDVIRETTAGIRADVAQQRKMIENGLGPDGRRLTPAERQQALRNLNFDTGRQISSMAANVRYQAQNTLASLRTNLANVILEGGKMRAAGAEAELRGEGLKLQAEGQRAGVQQAGIQALLQSQEGARAFRGMIADLAKVRESVRSSTQLSSLQYEMNGNMAMADMIRQNPETIIGVLSAFLTMGGIATAPGGRDIPALRF